MAQKFSAPAKSGNRPTIASTTPPAEPMENPATINAIPATMRRPRPNGVAMKRANDMMCSFARVRRRKAVDAEILDTAEPHLPRTRLIHDDLGVAGGAVAVDCFPLWH